MMRKIVIGLAAAAVVTAGSTIVASARYDRASIQHAPGWHGTGIWHGYHPRYPYYHRYYGYRGRVPWPGYHGHGTRRIGSERQ
jgi:hypothetical protein